LVHFCNFILELSACTTKNSTSQDEKDISNNNTYKNNYAETIFKEKYSEYFVDFETVGAMVSFKNNDPSGSTNPEHQELIQYGYCGIRSKELLIKESPY